MKDPLLITITGGSGSGKTTFVKMLGKEFSKGLLVISQDHYYRDLSHLNPKERDEVNFDHPKALDDALLLNHIEQLLKGKNISMPIYDFATHTRDPRKTVLMEAQPTIILDGIFSMAYEAIRNLSQLKIFIDLESDLRFIRRLQRDMQERGRTMESVIQQYCGSVRPMYKQHIEPMKVYADLLIHWENYDEKAVKKAVSLIKGYHSKSK